MVVVALLDFAERGVGDPVYRVGLRREDGELWTEKLSFTIVNLSNFSKSSAELSTETEDWLYLLKNLATMTEVPTRLKTPTFDRLLSDAEYDQLSPLEKDHYDLFWKDQAIRASEIKYGQTVGHEQGLEMGLAEGCKEGLVEGRKEGLIKGRKEGLNEGLAEGRETEKKETILAGHKIGLSLETIARLARTTEAVVSRVISEDG